MTSITHEAPALGLGGDQPASVTDALAYAADYQAMAAFLAEHPDLATRARYDGSHRFLIPVSHTDDPLEEIASAIRTAKQAGVEVEEYVSPSYGGISMRFGRVRLQVYARAELVLDEVVVGHVPDVRRALAIDLDGTPRNAVEVS